MTAKELEDDIKRYAGGSSFIRPGELAMYMGYFEVKKDGSKRGKSQKVKKFLEGAGNPENTTLYFIPDIARNIYRSDSSWNK